MQSGTYLLEACTRLDASVSGTSMRMQSASMFFNASSCAIDSEPSRVMAARDPALGGSNGLG
jgi:hypothetical protein